MDSRTEERLAAIGARQHGVGTVRQLHGVGFDTAAIKRWLRAGRLRRLHRGVYLLGGPVAPELAPEFAAVLACGPGSLVSHRSAARVWRMPPFRAWTGPVEVTVPGRDPGRKPGLIVHRARALDRRDVRRVRGVPVAAPARTLLDLATLLPFDELEYAFADARARGLVRDPEVAKLLERSAGRHGASALRRLLALGLRQRLTRSPAERRLLALVDAAELPRPEANTRVGQSQVDFLWRDPKVIVEVDSYAFHSDRDSFESDRERDTQFAADGYVVIRVTWRHVTETPEAVIARIAATLAVRSE